MKRGLIHLLLGVIPFGALSQTDVVINELNDGLYVTVEDLQYNDPIPPTYLINNLDIRERDYLQKVVELDSIRFYSRESDEMIIASTDLWGYCRNGIPYVWFDEQFARVQVVGSICHFTTIVEEVSYVSDPFDRMGMPTKMVTKEIKENIIDLSTGTISRFTDDAFLPILQRDGGLYSEYAGLKKKEMEQKRFFFLKKYNERNPFKYRE